jgi:putative ABC transport system permease protein
MNYLLGKLKAVSSPCKYGDSAGIPIWSLVRLSLSDLAHEYILTLCNALACAAALAPLLLLFGLRFGAVETLRHRLLEDPRNREIRPTFGQTFPRHWFKEMAERSDVAFIVPHIRQIAAGVEACREDSKESGHICISLDIAPTAPRDPLLREYGMPVPGAGECVLTAAAAQSLGIDPGDYLQVKVGRNRDSGWEAQSVILQVAGVLPPMAGALRLVYLSLPLVEAIERFKDGLAVTELGWEGSSGAAAPAYDGVIICGETSLQQQEEARLAHGTGLTEVTSLKAEDTESVLGYEMADVRNCLMLTAEGNFVEESTLHAVESLMKGQGYVIHPFVRPQEATMISDGGVAETRYKLVGVPAAVLEKKMIRKAESSNKPTAYMAAPVSMTSRNLRISSDNRDITIPLNAQPAPLPSGVLFIPIELAGQLNQLWTRPLEFEPETGIIRPLRRSYTSFRLYTHTLEDVVRIERLLREKGIQVSTEADRIQNVLNLDKNLGMLFWVIGTVAIVGGLFSLTTSLYASLERKRRDLGVLRLLGVPLRSLVIFPVTQGMAIAAAGLLLSLGLYMIGSLVADSLFAGHLSGSEQLCRAKTSHFLAAAVMTQLLAAAAGFLASARLSRSDPANILREEL